MNTQEQFMFEICLAVNIETRVAFIIRGLTRRSWLLETHSRLTRGCQPRRAFSLSITGHHRPRVHINILWKVATITVEPYL